MKTTIHSPAVYMMRGGTHTAITLRTTGKTHVEYIPIDVKGIAITRATTTSFHKLYSMLAGYTATRAARMYLEWSSKHKIPVSASATKELRTLAEVTMQHTAPRNPAQPNEDKQQQALDLNPDKDQDMTQQTQVAPAANAFTRARDSYVKRTSTGKPDKKAQPAPAKATAKTTTLKKPMTPTAKKKVITVGAPSAAKKPLVKGKAVAKTAAKKSNGTQKFGRQPNFAADGKIKILAKDNPKRADAARRFGLYKDGITVADYIKKGGLRADVNWDVKQKFIKVG